MFSIFNSFGLGKKKEQGKSEDSHNPSPSPGKSEEGKTSAAKGK
jgi:hypothetical protein